MADSLAMVKKYVYDRKELTLPQLREALMADFVGYEVLHTRLKIEYTQKAAGFR